MGQKLSDLMPNVALDVNELSNIKGGVDNPKPIRRVCDTSACSSNMDLLAPLCSEAICKTGA